MQVGIVGDLLVRLGEGGGERGVPGRLEDEFRPSRLDPARQVEHFGEVDDRRIGTVGAHATGKPFSGRDLGPDDEVGIVDLLGDALVALVGEAGPVGPGTTALPLSVIEGT